MFIRKMSLKIIVYLATTVILIASSIFYYCTKTSLAENFFATSLGMTVTILLIDTLLATDRIQKYKSLNKHIAKNLQITIGLCLINARKSLGGKQEYKIDDIEKSTDELASLLEKDLDMLVCNAHNKNLNKFCDIITKYAKSIEKALSEIAPFASTELRKLALDLSVWPITLKELLKLRSKTSTIMSSTRPNEIEQQAFSDIDEFLIEENKKIINEIKTTLLKIHELASKDKLQEII